MKPTEALVLSEDVIVFPLEDLDPPTRDAIAASPDEYGLTKRNSRRTTRVLDHAAAALLEEFRAPTSVPEALGRFSRREGADIEDALEDSFAFLTEMMRDGFLVLAAHAGNGGPTVPDQVGEWRVLEPLRVLDDTGVYLVSSRRGDRGVLKQVTRTAEHWIVAALRNEARVLTMLAGAGAPMLLEDGSAGDQPYIVLEWHRGLPSSLAASQVRRPWIADSRGELTAVCVAILDAYAALHERGVIHGDVHPANVLVDIETRTAVLIDFGLAITESDRSEDAPPRGGVQAFYPPEFSRAVLRGAALPQLTFASEQYSVAVLLYKLITGHEYLESALDPVMWHEAVCAQPPRSFVRLGHPPWPELEAVLARAMSKTPADRYPSLAAFRHAFARAAEAVEPPRRVHTSAGWAPPGLLETVLARLVDPADVVQTSLPRPTASLNFGGTGIAYFLYRASAVLERPDIFAAADLWIERARRDAARSPQDAFYDDTRGITAHAVGRTALYHSAVGLHCVDGLIACSAGQRERAASAIDALLACAQVQEERADLATGYAGHLLACGALLDALGAAGYAEERDRLIAFGRRRSQDLVNCLGRLDAPVPGASEAFLGIAHGWAGVVYALLRFAAAAGESPPDPLRALLTSLRHQAHRQDGRAWWPFGVDNDEVWTGWCHGSAGHALLWSYGQRFFDDPSQLELAVMAGEHAWSAPTHDTGHLCCGSAGQGYAFLALHRLTGDGIHVDRARQRLEHAVGFVGTRGMSPDSLYKGDLGAALLEADLAEPVLAAMPLFEPEAWP